MMDGDNSDLFNRVTHSTDSIPICAVRTESTARIESQLNRHTRQMATDPDHGAAYEDHHEDFAAALTLTRLITSPGSVSVGQQYYQPLLDSANEQLRRCIDFARSGGSRPRMLIVMSKPYSNGALDCPIASHQLMPTARVMQQSLIRSLAGSDQREVRSFSIAVSMSSRDWWLSMAKQGVIAVNRVPLSLPLGIAIRRQWASDLARYGIPHVRFLARSALVVFVGSEFESAYFDLLSLSWTVRVEQPVYSRKSWVWPIESVMLWREAFDDDASKNGPASSGLVTVRVIAMTTNASRAANVQRVPSGGGGCST